ncbi:MAG TPA: GerMN domain-containing protein [Candidatus Angelobacter sp.]|nr:GerMN domain-containing protein [Candidatus Angelobacter sp.]
MIPRHFQITIALLLFGILISGIYIIKLTNKEEAKNLLGMEERPVAPPLSGKPERISVLVAYDQDRALRWRQATVSLPTERNLRAREVLRAVLAQYLQNPSPHIMGKGSDIRDVYLINNETAVVDTTPQFADGHPSGILLEEMTICSLIETLNANVPGINRVKFVVDGRERETLAGHADLMSFYQSSSVHELAKEFE